LSPAAWRKRDAPCRTNRAATGELVSHSLQEAFTLVMGNWPGRDHHGLKLDCR
jgi:hypothetical protein